MRPYYEHAGITIYHGDCREVLPSLGRSDLLLTDPPYGLGAASRKFQNAKRRGSAKAKSRDYGDSQWDNERPPEWMFGLMLERARWAIVWGGNFFPLVPSRGWLVWDKDNGNNGYADCELAWTNLDKAVRRLRYRWMGMLQEPGHPKEVRVHPTQKPLPVMKWSIEQAPADCATVLDPFMGSGTTLLAAKEMDRCAVGIERDERYCEIAANRLAQGSLSSVAAPVVTRTIPSTGQQYTMAENADGSYSYVYLPESAAKEIR